MIAALVILTGWLGFVLVLLICAFATWLHDPLGFLLDLPRDPIADEWAQIKPEEWVAHR